MSIIAWIILGLLAGAIAKAIYPGRQGGGFLATMFLGVIGSFIGGALHSLITTRSLRLVGAGFTIPGVFLAVVGAVIAIYVWEMLNRRS